jgi:hypothetical protein
MRLASRSGLVATTLAIGAIAVPSAQAGGMAGGVRPADPPGAQAGGLFSGPGPDPPGAAQMEAQAFESLYHHANVQSAPPILRPARRSELLAINAAQAREAQRFSYNLPPTARYSKAEMNAYASAGNPVRVSGSTAGAPGDGFDYGDAAVGVGIAGGVALLLTAGTLGVRRRAHPRHP